VLVRILTAGLCLLVMLGCAKRTAKKPTASDEPSVTEKLNKPLVPSPSDKKDAKADEPNWVGDSRFKTDGPGLPADAPPGGKPGWGLPKGNYDAPPPKDAPPAPAAPAGMPTGMPPVAGAVPPQPAKPPAPPVAAPTAPKFSPVTEADMKEVWVFVENASGASGKMPSQLTIYQALVAADSKAAPLVKDGSIHLTGATVRESVWAFEAKAITSGGLVVTNNGVETLTAAELKKRLGK
jgi:hypothetical protein